jgi:hypothetical protein
LAETTGCVRSVRNGLDTPSDVGGRVRVERTNGVDARDSLTVGENPRTVERTVTNAIDPSANGEREPGNFMVPVRGMSIREDVT